MFSDTFGAPSSPGVYAVVAKPNHASRHEHVLYVGSSWNLRERVYGADHNYRKLYERMTPDYVVILKFVISDSYVELEKEVILAMKPLLNIQHNAKDKNRQA